MSLILVTGTNFIWAFCTHFIKKKEYYQSAYKIAILFIKPKDSDRTGFSANLVYINIYVYIF